MRLLLRFAAVQLLMLWQGGFLFYSAVVLHVGTDVLGSEAAQGAVTAQVTFWLNLIGAAALAGLALDLACTRDPSKLRARGRWALWGFVLACQVALFVLRAKLASYMDDELRNVLDTPPFYPAHSAYLVTSTAQWLACLAFAWLTLAAWRAEDRAR